MTTALLAQDWQTVFPFAEYNHYEDIWMAGDGEGYLVGKNGRVTKTTNNGDSWSQVASAGTDNLIGIHVFESSNLVVAIAEMKIFVSTDEAVTWTEVAIGLISESIIGTYFEDDLGYVYTRSEIYVTSDGGQNWSLSHTVNEGEVITDVKRINSSLSYYFTADGTLQKSSDNGITWSQVSQFDFGNNVTKFDFISEDIGLVSIQGNKLFKTTDGGITWVPVDINGSIGFQGLYLGMQDENIVYILANSTGLIKSTDGGTTWTNNVISAYGYERFSNLHIDKQGVIWAVGDYQTVAKSSDQGDTWTDIFSAEKGPLLHITAIGDDRLITGGTNQNLFLSDDGGASWTPTGERGYHKNNLVMAPNGDLYHTWVYSGLWKSSDAGKNWSQFYDPDGAVVSVDINSQGHILLTTAVAGNYFHLSTDGGQTWSITPTNDEIRIENVSFLTDTKALAWTANRILESVDGGVSWTDLDLDFSGNMKNVNHATDGTIWIITSTNGYKSTDQGASWEEISFPGASVGNAAFINEEEGWLISSEGAQGNIHYTNNGGTDWVHVDSSDFVLHDILITDTTVPQVIVVGDGAIIRRYGYILSSTTSYTEVSALTCFPNPGTDEVRVAEVPPSAPVQIHNASGQLVSSAMTTSDGSLSIYSSGLPTGLYYITIIANGTVHRGSWCKVE